MKKLLVILFILSACGSFRITAYIGMDERTFQKKNAEFLVEMNDTSSVYKIMDWDYRYKYYYFLQGSLKRVSSLPPSKATDYKIETESDIKIKIEHD